MRSRRFVTPARVLPLFALVILALGSAVAADTLLGAPADVDLRADVETGPLVVDHTHLVTVSTRYCHVPAVGSADRDVVVRFTVPDAPAWAAASVLPDRVELTLDPQRACTPFVDVTLLVVRTASATPPAGNATGNVTVLARAPSGTVNAAAEDTLVLPVSPPPPEAPLVTRQATLATDVAPAADAPAPAPVPLTAFALAGTLAGVGVAAWWTRP